MRRLFLVVGTVVGAGDLALALALFGGVGGGTGIGVGGLSGFLVGVGGPVLILLLGVLALYCFYAAHRAGSGRSLSLDSEQRRLAAFARAQGVMVDRPRAGGGGGARDADRSRPGTEGSRRSRPPSPRSPESR